MSNTVKKIPTLMPALNIPSTTLQELISKEAMKKMNKGITAFIFLFLKVYVFIRFNHA